MTVTESSLLSNFLLPPAPLSVSLSLQRFTELFPKSRQDDPAIQALYRELQKQRAQDIERVKQNISVEVKHGESQQRHIKRIRQARLKQAVGDDAVELAMEAKLFPEYANEQLREPFTVDSAVAEMHLAGKDLTEEIVDLENEIKATLASLQTTVGNLSDLRYGRFSKTPGSSDQDLSTEVAEGLRRIQQLCADPSTE
ncbi:uncharacterized protein PV09_02891 [Verruconis gallopava]|uniref:Cnl2/NKP2 family protein n=1 Tax=Verruconis gallopava TaxID=253628 RepID=A0A0D1Z0G2_9PEZI|nr:uncharacterized protein PV09_02891 [Verruconis gallopava]KIW06447.1 hypothetical protein PV09_02891 [Verruconis gallopava]